MISMGDALDSRMSRPASGRRHASVAARPCSRPEARGSGCGPRPTAPPSSLTLATSNDDKGRLLVQIADSGIGIPPERQSYLFRAFTQLDASSTRRFDGTGLGLYLSQRLAGLVGGDLRCKSVFGKGSVVTLALPLQPS